MTYTYRGTTRLDPDPIQPARGPKGGRPCGTPGGYQRHLEHGETACDTCRRAHNDDVRWRRRANGVKPKTTARCGTISGHRRHTLDGQKPCEPCRTAWNTDAKNRLDRNPAARTRRAEYARQYRAYMKQRKDAA